MVALKLIISYFTRLKIRTKSCWCIWKWLLTIFNIQLILHFFFLRFQRVNLSFNFPFYGHILKEITVATGGKSLTTHLFSLAQSYNAQSVFKVATSRATLYEFLLYFCSLFTFIAAAQCILRRPKSKCVKQYEYIWQQNSAALRNYNLHHRFAVMLCWIFLAHALVFCMISVDMFLYNLSISNKVLKLRICFQAAEVEELD